MEPRILVVGVGNEDRGDDGVGLLVARQLKSSLDDRARVIEIGGKVDELQEFLRNCDTAIIVDAAKSGAMPGTIHVFDATSMPIPVTWFHRSTHTFGIAEVLELAGVLNHLPARVLVYGIEGNQFEFGRPPSPEVQIAAKKVATMIINEVQDPSAQNKKKQVKSEK